MTRRMWIWAAVFTVLGGVFLGYGINNRVDWRQPHGTQLVMTMGQLTSIVFGAALIVVALLVMTTGARRIRDAKRRRRLLDRS